MKREKTLPYGLLATALCLASCYNPDYGTALYGCDPAKKSTDCPAGFNCIDQICRQSGAPVPVPAQVPGCTAGGVAVNADKTVYGCNGDFDNSTDSNKADRLCADGFHVCGGNDYMAVATIKPELCGTTTFYADSADVYVSGGPAPAVACPVPVPDPHHGLLGCGMEPPSVHLTNSCVGLSNAIVCGGDRGKAWSCDRGFGDAKHMDLAGGGVLCCQDQRGH